MIEKPSCNEGAANAALETTLAVELFLNENYCFRRNVLNGKVEFAEKSDTENWRPLTQEALNSIIRRAVPQRRLWSSSIQKMYPYIIL